MAIDGTFIHYLVDELKPIITNGHINKITQPTSNEIIFNIRNNFTNYQLYFNASFDAPRLNISYKKYDNPQTPPNFCMVLRKHLDRGIIKSIEQIGNDRVIKLTIFSYSELEDELYNNIYFEIMGRFSNIIITNNEDIIIDALHKFGPSEKSNRYIIPKAKYILKESNKLNPFTCSDDTFFEDLEGVSKDLLKEFNLFNNFKSVINRNILPVIYPDSNFFYAYPLESKCDKYIIYNSLSEILDVFFITQKAKSNEEYILISKVIEKEIKKRIKKLENLVNDLDEANSKIKNVDIGILLQTYLYKIKPKDDKITVNNFLGNNEEITIELDPNLNPSENLQRYFKITKKAEHAVKEVTEQIRITNDEIEYLETIFYQLEFLSLKELEQVKDELIQYKYLKRNKKQRITKNKIQILCYNIEGVEILVGKNNIQNDYLTHKLAKPTDYFFHVKDMPGSHVIVKTSNLNELIIRFAANLAACFSKGHLSSSVPVDYTLVKNIKKIPGVKGSKVTYTNNKTIYIDPDMKILEKEKSTYK